MKKFLSVLIGLMLVFSMTACSSCSSCSGKEDPDGDRQITKVDDKFFAQNGVSEYIITIPTEYSETEYFAATEMQNFFYQVSGAKMPIKLDVAVADADKEKIISIGETFLFDEKNFEIDGERFKGDAYVIKTDGLSTYILGANDRGTLYGTYEFVESILGVRFLTIDCNYVPTVSEVNFYNINLFDAPAFNIRMFLSGDLYTDPLFLARMRMGCEMVNAGEKYGGKIKWDTTSPHTTLYYVPTSEYLTSANREQNMHMYYTSDSPETSGTVMDICMTDGITKDGKIDNTMETSAFKVALKTLKKKIMDTDSDCTNFIFSQMDTTKTCQCPDCLEAEKLYKRSGINVRFANLLAQEINKWSKEEYDGREVNLIIFAYQYSLESPTDTEGNPLDATCIPDEHVFIRFASINNDQYYSFKDETHSTSFSSQLKNWAKITQNLMAWTYHTKYTDFLWPFPTIQTFGENLSMFQEFGAEYILMQSDHINSHNWQDSINTYVASKMLWDPSRDALKLREEFVKLYFGIASEEVMTVINVLEEKMFEISEQGIPVCLIYTKDVQKAEFYPIALLDSLVDTLKGAIDKIEKSNEPNKEELISRVKAVELTPLYMRVKNCDIYYSGDTVKRYNIVKEFVDLCDEVGLGSLNESRDNTNSLRNKYGIS